MWYTIPIQGMINVVSVALHNAGFQGETAESLLQEYNIGAVPAFPAWWLSPMRTSDLRQLILHLLTINPDERIGFG